MLDIDSKTLKTLKNDFLAIVPTSFFRKLVLANVFFLTLLILIIRPSSIVGGLIIVFCVLALISVNYLFSYFQRKFEIEKILATIRAIHNNRFQNSYDIRLPESLPELEFEIQAMFRKSAEDIRKLKELEKVRTQFLSNVSHELKTPVFAIQGFIETLKDGAIDDPNVNVKYLEKALNHTNHLNNLLTDLIELSRIESKEVKMSFRYFNLKDFLENIVMDLSIFAEDKDIKLVCGTIRENLEVYGDINRIRQVMYNLVSNAIRYTEKGRVDVLIEEGHKTVRIIVRDTGLGIPKKDLTRIFERFYRVDKERSKSMGGTGLGLAIVKHILEAHETGIEVQSVLGSGSEFSFHLKK